MDREQQPVTMIDLDDRRSRRSGVVTAIVVALLAAMAIAPAVMHDTASPADAPGVSMPVGGAAPSALCRPSFDVPQLLDPLARIVLPGWTQLCGWFSQPDLTEPLDPSD
jgi:hypothetical protein